MFCRLPKMQKHLIMKEVIHMKMLIICLKVMVILMELQLTTWNTLKI
jgi:hypothetical protein